MKSNAMFSRSLLPLLPLLLLASAAPLRAAIYTTGWTSGFSLSGVIPDGNATGWSDTRQVVIPANEVITDINVTITFSGGYNGDLYVYLAHTGSASSAVLLDRVGRTATNDFGYGDAGLSITFDDSAANGDIHVYQNVTGFAASISNGSSWQPDGRLTSPLAVVDSDSRGALLSVFNGSAVGGSSNWTLFAADLASGETTTIQSWGLSITTVVPEPRSALLLSLSAAALMSRKRRRPLPGV